MYTELIEAGDVKRRVATEKSWGQQAFLGDLVASLREMGFRETASCTHYRLDGERAVAVAIEYEAMHTQVEGRWLTTNATRMKVWVYSDKTTTLTTPNVKPFLTYFCTSPTPKWASIPECEEARYTPHLGEVLEYLMNEVRKLSSK